MALKMSSKFETMDATKFSQSPNALAKSQMAKASLRMKEQASMGAPKAVKPAPNPMLKARLKVMKKKAGSY